MSYVALATARFDQVVRFYGGELGFRTIRSWDRTGSRGRVFDLAGLGLEILDASREERPLRLETPGDRIHLVVEVEDLEAAQARLQLSGPAPQVTSWGARLFRLQDPDGVWVTFLEWVR